MRIKIIGENNCARATRHLLRLAGFAVTEFLPADALAGPSPFRASGPLAGYAITIDLAPAHHTPDGRRHPESAGDGAPTRLGPDPSAHYPHAAASEEASHAHSRSPRGASSPSSVPPVEAAAHLWSEARIHFDSVDSELEAAVLRHVTQLAAAPVIVDRPGGVVHSDRELRIVAPNTGDAQVDEAAAVAIEFGVLRGLLDLTDPAAQKKSRGASTGESVADEKPSRAGGKKKWWPFGIVFFTLLGSAGAPFATRSTGFSLWGSANAPRLQQEKAIVSAATNLTALPSPDGTPQTKVCATCGFRMGSANAFRLPQQKNVVGCRTLHAFGEGCGFPPGPARALNFGAANPAPANPAPANPAPARPAPLNTTRVRHPSALTRGVPRLAHPTAALAVLRLAAAEAAAQGQFATGQGIKITDGTNFLAVDPCAAQPKSYASINQTASAQLVAGTVSKKIYVCSIHVVVAAATNVAVVEGTGTVCGTGTAGVSGFGGATAATGWNFAANGGLTLGSGESSLGAEGTSGDNLCIFNSGSAQVSGGISYVVE